MVPVNVLLFVSVIKSSTNYYYHHKFTVGPLPFYNL